jgi:ABC-type uncharacterized transport system substrate-binding protein
VTKLTDLFGANGRVVDMVVPAIDAITAATAGEANWTQPIITSDTTSVNAGALTVSIDNNGSGALTGGNAANTMTVVVYYALESVV